MTESKAHDYILGKKLNSTSELQSLADEVIQKFPWDYEEGPKAAAAFITNVANLFCREMGFSGWQASYIPLLFLLDFTYTKNKCGIRVINYDDLLYPQYLDKFTTISKETWDTIREQAKVNLQERPHACDELILYWHYIACGNLPDGIRIK